MAICKFCCAEIETSGTRRIYCSKACSRSACKSGVGLPTPKLKTLYRNIKCANCQILFTTNIENKKFCCQRCCKRVSKIGHMTRKMTERAKHGRPIISSHTHPGRWTLREIDALRTDPRCVLPNRSLRAQWDKCHELGILRDRSLLSEQGRSLEAVARKAAASKGPLAYRCRAWRRRSDFRKRVRDNPAPEIAELRKLAGGHPLAEDIVLEGFATLLRLAIPAAEAFKLAKAEVNRTSAQPFREQSFNPDIDYAGRETGRQVSKASDIRSARGEG